MASVRKAEGIMSIDIIPARSEASSHKRYYVRKRTWYNALQESKNRVGGHSIFV